MVWKKSWISVFLWAVCLLGGSTALFLSGYETGKYIILLDEIPSIALSGGVLAIIAAVFCSICMLLTKAKKEHGNSRKGKREHRQSTGKRRWTEILLLLVLMGMGVFLRIYLLPSNMMEGEYYDIAKVTQTGGIPQVVHGATYFYLQMLRCLFWMVGNQWIAGIWMQILLSMAGTLIFYVAVRKLSSMVPAMCAAAFLLFSPNMIGDSLTYGPACMYRLFFGMGLLFVAWTLEVLRMHGRFSFGMFFLLLLTGLFIGMLSYLDLAGTLLLLAIVATFRLRKKPDGRSLILLFAAAGFAGCLFLDAFLSHKQILSVASAWLTLYLPKGMIYWGNQLQWTVAMVILLFCMVSYWYIKKVDVNLIWAGMLIGNGVFSTLEMFSQYMSSEPFLYLWIIIMGTGSLVTCIRYRKHRYHRAHEDDTVIHEDSFVGHEEDTVVHEEDFADYKEAPAVYEEELADHKEAPAVHKVDSMAHQQNSMVSRVPDLGEGFFKTPLPMPKKHVRKTAEYSIDVAEDALKYDVDVKEDDDYDI